MENKIKAQVVVLLANETYTKISGFDSDEQIYIILPYDIKQSLSYIVKGDYFIYNGAIQMATSNCEYTNDESGFHPHMPDYLIPKRIIATTDQSLGIPVIDSVFILQYLLKQGNIENVYLELEDDYISDIGTNYEEVPYGYRIKTREDNTCIISLP